MFLKVKYKEQLIKNEINGCLDKCFRCGKSGHFINECKENLINNDNNTNCWFKCLFCFRNKKQNNNSSVNINNKQDNDNNICDQKFKTENGMKYHKKKYCNNNSYVNMNNIINKQDEYLDVVHRSD